MRIDQLTPLYKSHGIGVEYGGHVVQILMPRGLFESHPEYFPMARTARGSRAEIFASRIPMRCDRMRERDDLRARVSREPDAAHLGCRLRTAHGASVPECKKLSPQLQYMKMVNTIAAAQQMRQRDSDRISRLSRYHGARSQAAAAPNVWFEWAPRERCYIHAIDDAIARSTRTTSNR